MLSLCLLSAVALCDEPATVPPKPWLSFDGLTEPPVRLQTRIPAETALAEGPEGHQAVVVTVPDMSRDEKACAFTLALPALEGQYNGVRLWVRGTAKTQRLEIVFRTDAGTYGTEVPLEEEWREVTLTPHNTHPFFDTKAGRLDVTRATEVRFCFGEWQGATGGPHVVSVGPMTAVYSPFFAPAGPVETVDHPEVPLPLQPFTVELLDLHRGRWHFADALGQHLTLAGPVTGYAFPASGEATQPLRLAYLCCDPEFPDDPAHATLKIAGPSLAEGEASWFRIEEPYFTCTAQVAPEGDALRCDLRDIALGPAVTGDRYVAALYVALGGRFLPIWLAPGSDAASRLRLLTDRVGHVFLEDEEPRVTLLDLGVAGDEPQEVALEVRDYASGKAVWRGPVVLRAAKPPARATVSLPLDRFGVFEVRATASGVTPATLRLTRLPQPRTIDPDRSAIGINLFQQQIWSYAYQVPLMAQAGVHWIRPWLAWENTWSTQEPEPGRWDTRALDAALRRMAKHGQRYQDILFSAPGSVSGGATCSVPPEARMDLWGAYIERLVTQYRGRIRHYEVWNEPDLMWPEETRHSGEHYLAMLKTTWEAAKRADADCVILGLSHAGYEEWLGKVGDLGAARYFDVATIHSYARPGDLLPQVERRREIMREHRLAGTPLWLNEIGATAYDFSPAYSAKYGCSERGQAAMLTALYAEALAADPAMKAFWFCTYDPRDAAHESQWTWDAGVGVLYLGFLPKLSYAALAGVGRQLDGRRALGRADLARDLHQVSFEGPLSVVWHDQPEGLAPLPATEVGCLPGEQITVRDVFTNEVASGRAGDLRLDLSQGTLYLEGSRQMAAAAQGARAIVVEADEVQVVTGEASVALTAPPRADIAVEIEPGLPLQAEVTLASPGTGRRLALRGPASPEPFSGFVRLRFRLPRGSFGAATPLSVTRTLHANLGRPNLIRDGGFFLGHLYEWAPERTSGYTWDATVGHAAPGSLRLDAPFDRRLVHWGLSPAPGRPLNLRCWVRTEDIADSLLSLNIALFAADKWLQTWCLAATGPLGDADSGWRAIADPATMPLGTTDWTLLRATLSADSVPPEIARAAFFIDASGEGSGRLWIDDLALWQPGAEPDTK